MLVGNHQNQNGISGEIVWIYSSPWNLAETLLRGLLYTAPQSIQQVSSGAAMEAGMVSKILPLRKIFFSVRLPLKRNSGVPSWRVQEHSLGPRNNKIWKLEKGVESFRKLFRGIRRMLLHEFCPALLVNFVPGQVELLHEGLCDVFFDIPKVRMILILQVDLETVEEFHYR